jgi:hypothetical protein
MRMNHTGTVACGVLGNLEVNKENTPLGNTCCSREEIDSLKTRWKSTKAEIYEKRIKAYASIIKSVVDAETLIRAEIATLSKKQAVKIDCKAAMGEVNKFLDKNNTRTMLTQWQNSAKTCLMHTIKLKIGLFCAICSPLAYKSPPDIFVPPTITTAGKIYTSGNDCKLFVQDCHEFIAAQMKVREYLSAVAALSKCDSRGWTDFDQEYLYRPQNEKMKGYLETYKNSSGKENETTFETAAFDICRAEYSLSTMLASDLKKKESWVTFVQNAESIFKKFNIKNDSPRFFYQADDENSVKQDLSDYDVNISGTTKSILFYFEDGDNGMASRKINESYILSLISGSKMFVQFTATILFALIWTF